jgi:hypothetical protein
MRRALGLLSAVVVAVSSLRCGGAPSPTASDTTPAARPDRVAAAWSIVRIGTGGSSVASTAVIDGFRVHPDPGDDGVIRVFEGQNVVINATDIASRPPAPQSYLIVNWGDNGLNNQRVGCGPCRLEHGYGAGRYTLVATADDLQPATPAGAITNRSISLVVEVSAQREARGIAPIQPFAFVPSDIAIGDTAFLTLPFFLPDGVTLTGLSNDCSPVNAATIGFFSPAPPIVAIPFTGNVAGTCTFSVAGTDAAGTPFSQTTTLTIH